MKFPILLNDGKNKHSKLGKFIARSMSMTVDNCPSECTLMNNGCYAQSGRVNLHAMRAREMLNDVYEFMVNLPQNWKMRHNVSGDFFRDDMPNVDYLEDVKKASKEREDLVSYGYTHGAVRLAPYKPNELPNLTINASCDTFAEIREASALGYPCVTAIDADLMPKDDAGNFLPMVKRDDMVLRICPNLLDENVKCSDCMLCARKGKARMRRNAAGEWVPLVVAFLLHGNGKKKAARALAAVGQGAV
jgi:hypothetical protein